MFHITSVPLLHAQFSSTLLSEEVSKGLIFKKKLNNALIAPGVKKRFEGIHSDIRIFFPPVNFFYLNKKSELIILKAAVCLVVISDFVLFF